MRMSDLVAQYILEMLDAQNGSAEIALPGYAAVILTIP